MGLSKSYHIDGFPCQHGTADVFDKIHIKQLVTLVQKNGQWWEQMVEKLYCRRVGQMSIHPSLKFVIRSNIVGYFAMLHTWQLSKRMDSFDWPSPIFVSKCQRQKSRSLTKRLNASLNFWKTDVNCVAWKCSFLMKNAWSGEYFWARSLAWACTWAVNFSMSSMQ